MSWLVEVLQSYPELALFLTLAIGYAVGKIQIGSFKIGTVPGVLVTGVFVGQFGITVDNTVKAVFFLLFLFALGYNAGPQFFKGLKKEGISQVMFAVVLCVIGFISAILVGKMMGFNAGQAGGLTAGALTQSSVIGVAQDAISKLDVFNQKEMMDFVPVGYAVTYIFGTLGCTFILTTFGPKILKVDLEKECLQLDQQARESFEDEFVSSHASDVLYRMYEINDKYAGCTVFEIESQLCEKNIQCFIIKVKRDNQVFKAKKSTQLHVNDCVAIAFKERDVRQIKLLDLGEEIFDHQLVNFRTESLEVCLKTQQVIGKSIHDIQENILTRGVMISKLKRAGEELAYTLDTVIKKHDVLKLSGPVDEVEQLVSSLGKAVRQSDETDMIFVGLGILIGGLIGVPALMIGKIGITLSTSGGALIMGLICGYLHSRRPTIGRMPSGASWFLSNVGLAAFVAVVGINAGPGFVDGLQSSGLIFFFAGMLVTSISTFSGIFLGKYVFKFSAPVILGATAGALTTTAAVGGLCEKAKSNAPVLGYTIPYTVGNILLTVWGSLIVIFFS